MLTLPPFQYHSPASLDEALALLSAHRGNVKVIAGGTDLLPNMKHRIVTPGHVVALKGIPNLQEVKEENGFLRLGALVPIAFLARDEKVSSLFPSLALAAQCVAGPQLREMGTLGGNICLDTRCVYVNQTHFWRKALGYCLKKDGSVCHVVKGGKNCVAAASNDTAPVLMTLDATLLVVGPSGRREVSIRDFYVADGIRNLALAEDELVVEVRIPLPQGTWVAGYEKLRVRAAIDYPALGVAAAVKLNVEKKVETFRVVVSALGSRPQFVKKTEMLEGRAWGVEVVEEACAMAHKQCHPLTNIQLDASWRKEMIPVLLKRALRAP